MSIVFLHRQCRSKVWSLRPRKQPVPRTSKQFGARWRTRKQSKASESKPPGERAGEQRSNREKQPGTQAGTRTPKGAEAARMARNEHRHQRERKKLCGESCPGAKLPTRTCCRMGFHLGQTRNRSHKLLFRQLLPKKSWVFKFRISKTQLSCFLLVPKFGLKFSVNKNYYLRFFQN